jgi:hypothetical protein
MTIDLSLNPDVCWFSNLSDRFPAAYGVSFTHRLLDVPPLRNRQARAIAANRRMFTRFNFVPWPDEGDRIYHTHCGFGQTPDGVETHLTEDMERLLKGKIKEHLEMTGKRRFLSKQTANNRRLGLIDRIFPDAYYVHVIRDGRAVANSTLRVPWWNDMYIWWLGKAVSEWNKQGREPIELCGLNWKYTVEKIIESAVQLGTRYVEVLYEDLTRDVHGVIGKIVDFCQLDRSVSFFAQLPETLPDMNRKWREQLTDVQKRALLDSVGEFLVRMGYSRDG